MSEVWVGRYGPPYEPAVGMIVATSKEKAKEEILKEWREWDHAEDGNPDGWEEWKDGDQIRATGLMTDWIHLDKKELVDDEN